MSDAKALLEKMKNVQAEIAIVYLCNPETKKVIEQRIDDISPNVYIIEEKYIEPNQVLVVKDLELKKTLIEMYESRKEQK